MDIDAQWKAFNPQKAERPSIYEELRKARIQCLDSYIEMAFLVPAVESYTDSVSPFQMTAHLHLAGFLDVIEPFIERYQDVFGKKPYLDRVNLEKL